MSNAAYFSIQKKLYTLKYRAFLESGAVDWT